MQIIGEKTEIGTSQPGIDFSTHFVEGTTDEEESVLREL